MFRLRFLGGAGIDGPDGPVGGAVVRRHPLALLALLVRSPRRTVSRDRAVALLWPEADEETARNRLRTTLHTVRSALGAEALLSEGDQLRLDEAIAVSDVGLFERALETGDALAAVDAYAGPFLDGFHLNGEGVFDRWADGERSELARRHEETLRRAAEAAEAAGDPAGAASWWERLVRERPLGSRAVVRAMEAWAAAGERGRALELAAAHSALLREELETDPADEVVELERRIRASTGSAPSSGFQASLRGQGDDVRPVPSHPGRSEPSERSDGRRGTAATVAALSLIALLAIVPAALAPSGPAPAELSTDRVLVAAFEADAHDPSLDYLATLAPDWIARGMVEMGSLTVVPRYGGFAAPDDPVRAVPAREAARAAGAALFVTGSVRTTRDSIFLQARIGNAGDGTLVRLVDPVSVPTADAARGVQLLSEQTAAALATHMDPRLTRWAGAARQPPNLAAYRHFVEGLHHFTVYPSDWDAALESFLRASENDDAFTLPLLWATYVSQGSPESATGDSILAVVRARYDGLTTWERAFFDALAAQAEGDLEGAYRSYGEVVRLTPRSEFTLELAGAALSLNRPAEAVGLLRSIDPPTGRVKESPFFHYHLTRALHLLGRHEEELLEARRFLGRFPTHGNAMGNVAMALIGLGRIDEALAFVDSVATAAPDRANTVFNWVALDLRAHGHVDEARVVQEREVAAMEEGELWRSGRWGPPSLARPFFAERLLRAGRVQDAYDLMAAAVDEEPDNGRVLQALAEAAYRTGREAEARKAVERLERLEPGRTHPSVLAVTGRVEEAMEQLSQSPVPPIFLHLDPRLDPLRSLPGFQEAVRPKG